MEAQGIRCPICGQIDSVQKVSSIVHGGTSYGEASGGGGRTYVTMYSKSQTVLSSQLAIPELNLDLLDQLRMVGIVILCFAIPWALFGSWVVLNAVWAGYINLQSATILYSPTVFGLLFLLPALILKGNKIARDRPKRERAHTIWVRLYYCYRDDVVFVPGSPSQYFPASDTRKILGY